MRFDLILPVSIKKYMTNARDDQDPTVTDPWQLSKRQLLVHIITRLDRMETAMTASSDYLTAALESLDVQMQGLQVRLTDEATQLKAAQDALAAALSNDASDAAAIQEAQGQLNAAADRVQATAVLVAGLAVPSQVADPAVPADADPVAPVAE